MIEIRFFCAVVGQLGAGFGDGADVGRAVVLSRVDADGVTTQRRGGVDPLLVVLDGLVPLALSVALRSPSPSIMIRTQVTPRRWRRFSGP